jgi:nicotinate-nucleotide adenylyltransferase
MMTLPGELGLTRLGVMGGTFDPIHIGHLIAASEALHRFQLDRVLFVPTGQPWQKSHYSDAEDRFMMASLGAATHHSFAVSRIELDRKGPTFTADTMGTLKEFHGPRTQLFFILGADAALRLGTWKKVEGLAGTTELIAVTRPGFALGQVEPVETWPTIHTMEMPGIDVSATDVRERVRSGRPIDFLVPAAVVTYIHEQGLYLGPKEVS